MKNPICGSCTPVETLATNGSRDLQYSFTCKKCPANGIMSCMVWTKPPALKGTRSLSHGSWKVRLSATRLGQFSRGAAKPRNDTLPKIRNNTSQFFSKSANRLPVQWIASLDPVWIRQGGGPRLLPLEGASSGWRESLTSQKELCQVAEPRPANDRSCSGCIKSTMSLGCSFGMDWLPISFHPFHPPLGGCFL